MRRSLTLALLTVSLAMPAVIAVSETCHVDFKEVWARKVASIKAWNKSHASYVARHHLDRDMSAQTRRMKERARRSLEVMCNIPVLDAEPNLGGLLDIPSEAKATPKMEGRTGTANVPTGSNELTNLIAQEEYPTYEATRRDSVVDGERGSYPGFPGWFGSAGYLPPGTTGGVPGGPGTIIAPTPESSSIAFIGIGLFATGLWRSIRR